MWSINPDHSLFAEVEYYNRSIDGIEYIQEWNNAYEESKWEVISKNIRSNFSTKRTTAKVDYMQKKGNSYGWWAGVEVEKEALSDIYYLPRSTQDVENIYFTAHVKKNFIFGKNAILVGVNGGMKKNQSGELTYSGNYADSDIYKNMVVRDFRYLQENALMWGAELSYTRGGLFKSNSAFFLNLKYNHIAPNDSDGKAHFDKYSALVVKAGLTF
jgi:hypothetical protein